MTSDLLEELSRAGCHSIDLHRYKGGWPADQRAPGPTTWSASGQGYWRAKVSRWNSIYFGSGQGKTQTEALKALLVQVKKRNRTEFPTRKQTRWGKP